MRSALSRLTSYTRVATSRVAVWLAVVAVVVAGGALAGLEMREWTSSRYARAPELSAEGAFIAVALCFAPIVAVVLGFVLCNDAALRLGLEDEPTRDQRDETLMRWAKKVTIVGLTVASAGALLVGAGNTYDAHESAKRAAAARADAEQRAATAERCAIIASFPRNASIDDIAWSRKNCPLGY